MVQWVKLPPAKPACHRGTSPCPSCLIPNAAPCWCLAKAAEYGPVLGPRTPQRSRSSSWLCLVQLWPSQPFGQWISRWPASVSPPLLVNQIKLFKGHIYETRNKIFCHFLKENKNLAVTKWRKTRLSVLKLNIFAFSVPIDGNISLKTDLLVEETLSLLHVFSFYL